MRSRGVSMSSEMGEKPRAKEPGGEGRDMWK